MNINQKPVYMFIVFLVHLIFAAIAIDAFWWYYHSPAYLSSPTDSDISPSYVPVWPAIGLAILTLFCLHICIDIIRHNSNFSRKAAVIAPFTMLLLYSLDFRIENTLDPSLLLLLLSFLGQSIFWIWMILVALYWQVMRSFTDNDRTTDVQTARFLPKKLAVNFAVVVILFIFSIQFRTASGRMLIHDCSYYGFTSCVVMLKVLGQDINQRTADGCTPLHFAVNEWRTGTVRYLLDSDADINARNKGGETPAMLAELKSWACNGKDCAHCKILKLLGSSGNRHTRHQ